MNKIRCVIVDDEPHALALMKEYVLHTPFLELVGECTNAKETAKLLRERHVDLLFLDVQMPNLSGMTLAKSLENGPKIIFTTAFQQYALEGFKVDAIDYLLKPFSEEEFLKAANKARKLIELEQPSQVNITEQHILIKADYKIWQIPLSDILYFEGIKDYVKIYRQSIDKVLMPLLSMKTLEEKLPTSLFMRVHRSYIVNLNNIQLIERNQIIFGDKRITVSENYKEAFQAFLQRRFIQ